MRTAIPILTSLNDHIQHCRDHCKQQHCSPYQNCPVHSLHVQDGAGLRTALPRIGKTNTGGNGSFGSAVLLLHTDVTAPLLQRIPRAFSPALATRRPSANFHPCSFRTRSAQGKLRSLTASLRNLPVSRKPPQSCRSLPRLRGRSAAVAGPRALCSVVLPTPPSQPSPAPRAPWAQCKRQLDPASRGAGGGAARGADGQSESVFLVTEGVGRPSPHTPCGEAHVGGGTRGAARPMGGQGGGATEALEVLKPARGGRGMLLCPVAAFAP